MPSTSKPWLKSRLTLLHPLKGVDKPLDKMSVNGAGRFGLPTQGLCHDTNQLEGFCDACYCEMMFLYTNSPSGRSDPPKQDNPNQLKVLLESTHTHTQDRHGRPHGGMSWSPSNYTGGGNQAGIQPACVRAASGMAPGEPQDIPQSPSSFNSEGDNGGI